MKERMITVTCPRCRFCGTQSHLRVPVEGWIKRMDGALAQDAFPRMSEDKREMLITGIHALCWERLMAELEEEDA